MSAALYPELTSTEVDEIIEPLTGVDLALPAQQVLDDLGGRDLARSELGAGAEDYTFHRICEVVARHAFERLWDPALDAAVADPDRFRREVEVTLVRDFFALAVRPLATMVEPEPHRDSREVYQDFCRHLLATSLAGLADAHPVTWARAGLSLQRRMGALVEALRRLVADAPDLERFLGAAPGRVASLTLAGDTHAGGRSVSVVEFETGQRVVYKPRPVDAEAAYADLVEHWNSRVGSRLQAARVLPRRGYGYMQFVTAEPDVVPDLTAVGELAALLYALNARDMHFENILTTRQGPVAIDLETLLHPQRHKARGLVETDLSAYRKMDSSVFAMGVLPMIMARPGREGYLDVGFMGGGEARGPGPFRRLAVEEPFSAEVRVHWDRSGELAAPRRQELPEEAQQRTHAAIRDMVDGFTTQYSLIVSHRDEFLAAVEDRFGTARLRYVHNATVQYEQCLRTLTGASAGADRALAGSLLKRIAIASRGADHRLVASECAQMWRTDVPYFLVRADRTAVVTAQDDTTLAELPRTPLEQLRSKIRRLGPSDLEEQVALIRVALSAKLPDPHGMDEAAAVFDGRRTSGRCDDGALAALAGSLAGSLAEVQLEDRYPHLPATWIGPVASSDSERPWPPGVLGYDLYTGRTGPALALVAAGVVLDDETLVAAGRRVFDPMAAILADSSYEARSLAAAGVGAYNGFAGAVWSLWQAGRLTGSEDLLAAARVGHGLLPPVPVSDAWFDVVAGGVARCLVVGGTGGAGDPLGVPEAVDFALDSALPRRLESSGFAHGLSGLLFFAARAHARTGSARAGALVRRCHEELVRGFGAAGFPLRTNRSGIENYTDSWCNGSAGTLVALSEAVTVGALPPEVLDPVVQGLRTSKVSTSLTFCHGMLGLHDALARAGTACPSAAELREDVASMLGARLITQRLADPTIRYNQSPGLMTGRAGVLWHLLDRVQPGRLPSPLALDDGVGA